MSRFHFFNLRYVTILGILVFATTTLAWAQMDSQIPDPFETELPSLNTSAGSSFFKSAQSTDWAQPPVGCIEEIVQQKSPYPCPDFSGVKDPVKDFPPGFTSEEIALWSGPRAKALGYCRSEEVVRREAVRPGTFSEVTVERAWMRVEGARDSELKAEVIHRSSEQYGVPPQILVGALMQESLMADLGISEDGSNFSCGIAQLNVIEWCNWVEKQSEATQAELGWPTRQAAEWRQSHSRRTVCAEPLLTTTLIRPFHRIGIRNLKGLPEYRLGPEQMAGIQLKDVLADFPQGTATEQSLRFEIAKAFTQNCSRFASAIPAKANQLKILFDNEIPPAMRSVQSYGPGETYGRSCQRPFPSRSYPLHLGWLMADAIYNAGSKIVTNLAWYLRLTSKGFSRPESWQNFYGPELITGLYWAGKYNPTTDNLEFQDFSGKPGKITFFKSCIVQRHVARVIQYATLPGYELARSAEDKNGCRKSEFNPDGSLKKTHVPLERRKSSGRI